MSTKHPYDEAFLNFQLKLHHFVFQDFLENEKYDFYSIADTYLRTSAIRAKMDVGNAYALNTANKGIHSSIDYSLCKEKDTSYIAPSLAIAHWMGKVYCMVQWMYRIPSREISEHLPAKKLASIYENHCENSLKGACKNIYREYLFDIKPIEHVHYEERENNEPCQE